MEQSNPLSRFENERVISLETYRRNGQPVRTPVWFLRENELLYVYTDDSTGKVKRLRRNSRVKVAPSHFRGKPKADYINAEAHIETAADFVDQYHTKIYNQYGWQATVTRLLNRFSRSKAHDVIIVIRPS